MLRSLGPNRRLMCSGAEVFGRLALGSLLGRRDELGPPEGSLLDRRPRRPGSNFRARSRWEISIDNSIGGGGQFAAVKVKT